MTENTSHTIHSNNIKPRSGITYCTIGEAVFTVSAKFNEVGESQMSAPK